THPVHGMIPPAEFVPIAEENGSIMAIGEWVLRTACRQAASWGNGHKIAVNLSPVQFAHADLAKLIHQILIETGLSPKRLELELTESTIVADKVRTLHVLRQIKALGVTIAIDDFGTGYSSLDTLRSFPFDKIKLDRSFMADVERSPQAKAIIRAVLTLGRSLDIPVLAEGVETHVQLTILQVEGCNEAQGYFLGRPKPIDQITGDADVSNDQLVAEEPARMRLSRQA
ncbi:EAL domain-containing protein, partial [Mesorhizobium sp. M7A.F.Ca.CA.004.05.2.1]|uniref:EAL domain-containing protein n=1 Tax=Mesorhizobium sp. M7A.F.Ca.CA.004.05.2.1 TaxID=2496716 RepID=UPI001FDF36EE